MSTTLTRHTRYGREGPETPRDFARPNRRRIKRAGRKRWLRRVARMALQSDTE